MKHILKIASFVMLVATLASCAGGGQSNQSTDLKKDSLEKSVREYVYPLPSSFEVTEMLNRIEAAYILGLSNPASNVDKYFTAKSQALNLGVYSADLSYASTYNQKQETVEFMNASKKLIEKLDITAALDPQILENIEKNLENKDELVNLITNSFYDTYEYLNKNERTSVSMLVLAGSWTEALYIATHITEDTFNNREMVKIILDQKEPLVKLMAILTENTTDADVQSVLEDLKDVHSIFMQVETGSITESQVKAIAEKIAIVREKFIS